MTKVIKNGTMVAVELIGLDCGLSHNEAEEISPEWAREGANVLFHAVVEMAEIVG